MCIGIPMRVVSLEGDRALCTEGDARSRVDIRLIDRPDIGSWLLVFAGAAREVISAERAEQVSNALLALQASAKGDLGGIDLLFADLVEREPQLPPHLQAALNSGSNKGN